MDPVVVKITEDTSDLLTKTKQAVTQVNNDLKSINTAPVSAGFKQVVNDVKQSENEVKSFSDKAKDALKSVKDEAGKGSLLGQGLKLAVGGGAIAGIGLAAKEFENFSEKIRDAANEQRKGNATTEETLGKLLREIPILGDATKGFDALADAVTGESAALAKQDEQTAESNKKMDAIDRDIAQRRKDKATLTDEIRTLDQKLELQNTPKSQRPIVEARQERDNVLKSLNEHWHNTNGLPDPEKDPVAAKNILKSKKKVLDDLILGQKQSITAVGGLSETTRSYSQGHGLDEVNKYFDPKIKAASESVRVANQTLDHATDNQNLLDIEIGKENQYAEGQVAEILIKGKGNQTVHNNFNMQRVVNFAGSQQSISAPNNASGIQVTN